MMIRDYSAGNATVTLPAEPWASNARRIKDPPQLAPDQVELAEKVIAYLATRKGKRAVGARGIAKCVGERRQGKVQAVLEILTLNQKITRTTRSARISGEKQQVYGPRK